MNPFHDNQYPPDWRFRYCIITMAHRAERLMPIVVRHWRYYRRLAPALDAMHRMALTNSSQLIQLHVYLGFMHSEAAAIASQMPHTPSSADYNEVRNQVKRCCSDAYAASVLAPFPVLSGTLAEQKERH